MTKIGSVFQFTAPTGWRQFEEGGRQIFHGPRREELIVSAWIIEHAGSVAESSSVRERLFNNAGKAVKGAVANPALKVTRPFQKDIRAVAMECWTVEAETIDGDIVFYQTIFNATRGVLMGTLEAPKSANAERVFGEFVKSVEVRD